MAHLKLVRVDRVRQDDRHIFLHSVDRSVPKVSNQLVEFSISFFSFDIPSLTFRCISGTLSLKLLESPGFRTRIVASRTLASRFCPLTVVVPFGKCTFVLTLSLCHCFLVFSLAEQTGQSTRWFREIEYWFRWVRNWCRIRSWPLPLCAVERRVGHLDAQCLKIDIVVPLECRF